MFKSIVNVLKNLTVMATYVVSRLCTFALIAMCGFVMIGIYYHVSADAVTEIANLAIKVAGIGILTGMYHLVVTQFSQVKAFVKELAKN